MNEKKVKINCEKLTILLKNVSYQVVLSTSHYRSGNFCSHGKNELCSSNHHRDAVNWS